MPKGNPFSDVLTAIGAMSLKLYRLRAEMEPLKAEITVLKTEHLSNKEQIESLRVSLGELEDVVFREIAMLPKKNPAETNPTVADVPNRHQVVQSSTGRTNTSPED